MGISWEWHISQTRITNYAQLLSDTKIAVDLTHRGYETNRILYGCRINNTVFLSEIRVYHPIYGHFRGDRDRAHQPSGRAILRGNRRFYPLELGFPWIPHFSDKLQRLTICCPLSWHEWCRMTRYGWRSVEIHVGSAATEVEGVNSVQRVVCGGCLDFKARGPGEPTRMSGNVWKICVESPLHSGNETVRNFGGIMVSHSMKIWNRSVAHEAVMLHQFKVGLTIAKLVNTTLITGTDFIDLGLVKQWN